MNYLAFGTKLVATQWLGMGVLVATITIMGLRSARGNRAVGIDLRRGVTSPQAAAS